MDDRLYVCGTCGRDYHVSAGDPALTACLADGCDGTLTTDTVEDFADRYPELVGTDILPEPEAVEPVADAEPEPEDLRDPSLPDES